MNPAEIIMPYNTGNFDSQKMTAFVPEVNADKLPEEGAYMRFTTKLYSGNLMDAYKKGPSVGYDWCTNHDFSGVLYTPDRTYSMKSCMAPVRYYYSCSTVKRRHCSDWISTSRNNRSSISFKNGFPRT